MNDKDKETWNLGKAKIYASIWLENPMVVGSPEGISEIHKFISELQAENKKLREALEKIACNFSEDYRYDAREAIKEVGEE